MEIRLPATFLAVVTLLVDVTYQVRAAALIDDNNNQVGFNCPGPVRYECWTVAPAFTFFSLSALYIHLYSPYW